MGSDRREDFVQFFQAKAWALVHDPPTKMWTLLSEGCFQGSHEEEAEALWRKLGFPQIFGGLSHHVKEVVGRADVLASSFDRWVIAGMYMQGGKAQSVFRYRTLHSIFAPHDRRYRLELGGLNCEAVKKYKDAVRRLLEGVGGLNVEVEEKARLAYHLLYASYELLWIAGGLPPGLADTRAPTHTVFDHLYATAAVVNWLWPDGKPKGYFVLFDVPGVQRVVMAARKAGDFWAGSWLLSMASWLAAWPLVKRYGPDALLTPTARLNPYYLWLLRRYAGGHHLNADELVRRYVEVVNSLVQLELQEARGESGFEKDLDGWLLDLVKNPLIPATLTFMLPKVDGLNSVEAVRRELYDNFDRALRCLVFGVALGRDLSACQGLEVVGALQGKLGDGDAVRKVAEAVEGAFGDAVFMGLLTPRIYVVDVEEAYGELSRAAAGSVGAVNTVPRRIAEKVRDFVRRHRERLGRAEEVVNHLLFHVVTTDALQLAIRREEARRLTAGKAWFGLGGGGRGCRDAIPPTASSRTAVEAAGGGGAPLDYDRLVQSGVGWIHCTLCGEEPAIIKFGKEWRPCGDEWILTYSEDTAKALSLNIDYNKLCGQKEEERREERKKLDRWRRAFKPGEALGPLCLAKRLLYYAVHGALGVSMDTTEDVAIGWYARHVFTRLRTLLGEECGRVKSYVDTSSGRDLDSHFGGMEEARRAFQNCLKRAMDLCSCDPREDSGCEGRREACEGVLREVGAVYGMERAPWGLLGIRDTVAVVKADADYVGRLLNAELDVLPLLELLDELRTKSAEFAEDFARARAFVEAIAWGLTGGRWLSSPAYRAALSMALMVTALRDAFSIEHRHGGMVVFVGGDDVLALAPVDTALDLAADLRRGYWGDGGFHRLKNYAVPAPVAFGRSISLRYINVMDHMSEEMSQAVDLLEEKAKEARWGFEKDSIVISDSRAGVHAVLPLRSPGGDVAWHLRLLRRLWLKAVEGSLSGNAPDDYLRRYAEAGRALDAGGVRRTVAHVLGRNLRDGPAAAEAYAAHLAEPRTADGGPLADEVFKALAILRRYP